MLIKTWNPTSGRFDVTFDLPAELDIDQAAVVGEFNDWSESANPMTVHADGRWTATIALEPARRYRFRYHLGDQRWENDWSADDYVGNDFGGADSVVVVPDEPTAPPPAKAAAPRQVATKKKAAATKAPAKKKAAKKKTATKAKKAAKKAVKKATKRATPRRED